MENFNNMINNEYNAMVYGASIQQQQHPMTTIPREMQLNQNTSLQQAQIASQQSDIINLSYNQRDIQLPHPDLPLQMGLYPTISVPPQIQQHNHILQQQQQNSQQQQQHTTSIEQTEQEIPQNVSMSYAMDNVEVDVNLDAQNVQKNMDSFENNEEKEAVDNSLGEASELMTQDDPNVEQQTDAPATETTENETKDEQSLENQANEEEETKKSEPDVDPNQCRVCKATETLIDIFAIEEDMRICDIIMKMCNNIRIHERDSLPHMICIGCLGRLRIAYQFFKDVAATDKELRSKLKRSTKARKNNEKSFVIIDCNEFSESDDDEQNDDEDYQASNVEEEDETSSGADTDAREKKKARQPRKRAPRKSRSKKPKQELNSTTKRLKRDIVYIEANDSSDEKNKKREKCRDCNKIFGSKTNLKLHRKNAHQPKEEEAPFKCHVCGRCFKYSINLTSHMQIHKDSYTCDECGRVFATKTDVKKHALNLHKCSLSYECNKCRRLYCSVKRYQKHRESCSEHHASNAKKKLMRAREEVTSTGRDLFKTVAPVTTTYWSDSFSD
ncbi:hypothetical protein ACKWTF_004105 [Chironomus riparius]